MKNRKLFRSIRNPFILVVILVTSWLGSSPLYADPTPTPTATATATSTSTPTATGPVPAIIVGDSQGNFVGDRLTFPVNMRVVVDPHDGTTPMERCLKAGTELRGIGQFVKDESALNFVVITCNPWPLKALLNWLSDNQKPACKPECKHVVTNGRATGTASEVCTPCVSVCQNVMCDPNDASLPMGSTIQVRLADVHKFGPNRYGFAYGTLVVPFKFQLTGAHQFTGSASLGPYLGYRFDTQSYGWATTLALFGGVSNIAVSKTTTNPTTMQPSTSTEQIAGFSYGGACMVEVKGGFQAGVVLGGDNVGSHQGFQYNNKPWLAFELGYSFSQ